MRDDTFFSIGHDRKYLEEYAALHAHLARTKPLERTPSRVQLLLGLGAALLIGGAMLACVAGMVLGYVK